jgi:hypothetical protein
MTLKTELAVNSQMQAEMPPLLQSINCLYVPSGALVQLML